jgi:hypothetical protein
MLSSSQNGSALPSQISRRMIHRAQLSPYFVANSPTVAATPASTRASKNSCTTILDRLAPSALRTTSSASRELARANIRRATLPQTRRRNSRRGRLDDSPTARKSCHMASDGRPRAI